MKDPRLLRSMMFVPAHNRRLLAKASRTAADAFILDLEDSVGPDDQKQVARDTAAAVLAEGMFDGRTVFVRVNDRESGHLLEDVTALTIDGVDGFVYPKSHSGADVYFFDRLLETTEAEKGIPSGRYKVIPLIETAAAVLNALEICRAAPARIVAIAFGCEDFVSDLGGVHDEKGRSIYTARAMIAMAAKAAGVQAIDTVHIRVHDLEHLQENLILARELGFDGMLVLHPKELDLVHRFLSPSAEEVEEAGEMIRLFEEAISQRRGIAILNGRFIGPPMVLAARKTLARHALIDQTTRGRAQ